jgi:DNA-binding response OmpR family regulator
MPSKWRVLIIEDDENILSQIRDDANLGKLLPEVREMDVDSCSTFSEAIPYLDNVRFDFLILDLGKDRDAVSSDDASGGLTIFEEIKKKRFVPVVFYTALAHYVRGLETPFVRVVEKTEGLPGLRREIQGVFKTGLPSLLRHIEEEQRVYMWDFVENSWQDTKSCYEKADLAYLLARRLAHSLRERSIRRFLKAQGVPTPGPEEIKKIHPVEMYIKPVDNSAIFTGYILKGSVLDDEGYWIVLTPSCDFEQGNAERVLLAKCFSLETQPEYKAHATHRTSDTKGKLKSLLRGRGDKRQIGRFKYLPKTFFIPDLVVDLQYLVQIPREALKGIERIASLDSPFIESIFAQLCSYYGRIGTPDLDIDLVISRIESSLPNTR